MSRDDSVYVFADPFGRLDSGVSSYVSYASGVLSRRGIHTDVISRTPHESLKAYRKRLAREVSDLCRVKRRVIVEAPETDAVTTDIPADAAQIHIRLHCSRQLGAMLQGGKVRAKSVELEQREIRRAMFISAPSQSAVIASRLIFDLPKTICCYPNPAPCTKNDVKHIERDYVLFVGRFHALKGVEWILDLVTRLPEVSFVMFGPNPSQRLATSSFSNLRIMNGAASSKINIYSKAKLVIIPSLYETASMVGVEALEAGVPLVAWRHLGIAEYAPLPLITLVEPFQIEEFAEAVLKIVRSPSPIASQIAASSIINELYFKGLHATLNNTPDNFMPVKLSKSAVLDISSSLRKTMELSVMRKHVPVPSWRRKLRKLKRDPALFFRDWWLKRRGMLPTYNLDPKKLDNKPLFENPKKSNQFTNIVNNKPIQFQVPPQNHYGSVVAFLHPEDREGDAVSIIEGLSRFDDFRYVQQPLLQVGTFQKLNATSALTLIETIYKEQKNRISDVDHIVLLDPDPLLVKALRSCGTRQRTIVIWDNQDTLPQDQLHTDVLIIVGEDHPAAATEGWRRKIVVRDRSHVPLAIRRAIQEGTPKSPDMLLPLFGFDGNYREELLNFNVEFHQGLLYSALDNIPKSSTMEDLCCEISRNMTKLAVAESVYLRYRSLCDRIENDETRANFLTYCLYDGILFDVHS